MLTLLRLTILVLALPLPNLAHARAFFVEEIPNGATYRCSTCHINPNGGGPRNAFGTAVWNSLGGNNLPNWPALYSLDSDNDGFTNGEELGDPCGVYRYYNNPPPPITTGITRPGDATSIPAAHTLGLCSASSSSSSAPPSSSATPSSSAAASSSSSAAMTTSSSAPTSSSLADSSSASPSSSHATSSSTAADSSSSTHSSSAAPASSRTPSSSEAASSSSGPITASSSTVDAQSSSTADPDENPPAGCGCGASAPSWLPLSSVLWLLRRRRHTR